MSLLVFAEKGDVKNVTRLIKRGSPLNVKDSEGKTPLMHACIRGHHAVVNKLLTGGADTKLECCYGATAFFYASGGHCDWDVNGANRAKCVMEFIRAGADVNQISEVYNTNGTPLCIASLVGNDAVVKVLLDNNAAIDVKGSDGCTALMLAVSQSRVSTVKLLIKRGADIRIRNNKDLDALCCACQIGNVQVINLLIEAGCSLYQLPWSAVHMASAHGQTGAVKHLLNLGADVNSLSKNNNTPLLCASNGGHYDVVATLIAAGAELDLKGYFNHTAMFVAASKGYAKIVSTLAAAGASLNVQCEYNMTALAIASSNGYTDVVEVLLKYSADTTVQDDRGETALTRAIDNNHDDIVYQLIRHDIQKKMSCDTE
jgi:ankyrin repeat protein